jgi:hypothetical protein
MNAEYELDEIERPSGVFAEPPDGQNFLSQGVELQQSYQDKSSKGDCFLPSSSSRSQGSFGRKTKPKGLKLSCYMNSEGSAGSVSRREGGSNLSDRGATAADAALFMPIEIIPPESVGNPRKHSIFAELMARKEDPLHVQKAVPAYIFLG